MRMSNWSSDVCSSDLRHQHDALETGDPVGGKHDMHAVERRHASASDRISRNCSGTAGAPKTGAAMNAAAGRIMAISQIHSWTSTFAKPGAKPGEIIAAGPECARKSRE